MMNVLKNFDQYSLKARVFPALIAGLPTLALLFMLVPWDYLGLSQITATIMSFVLLFAFADLARSNGKRVEAKLKTNETPEQWYRGNTDVAEAAKDRYRAFLSVQLKTAAPTAEDEQATPAKANDFYRSAANWIREHTRDVKTYHLLFNENITYGFRRNLLGLKTVSLVFNALILAVVGLIAYFDPSYFSALPHIDEKLVIIAVAALLHSAYMIFAVNKSSVREASKTYGRQLILSCETLVDKPKPKPKKRETKDNVDR